MLRQPLRQRRGARPCSAPAAAARRFSAERRLDRPGVTPQVTWVCRSLSSLFAGFERKTHRKPPFRWCKRRHMCENSRKTNAVVFFALHRLLAKGSLTETLKSNQLFSQGLLLSREVRAVLLSEVFVFGSRFFSDSTMNLQVPLVNGIGSEGNQTREQANQAASGVFLFRAHAALSLVAGTPSLLS